MVQPIRGVTPSLAKLALMTFGWIMLTVQAVNPVLLNVLTTDGETRTVAGVKQPKLYAVEGPKLFLNM